MEHVPTIGLLIVRLDGWYQSQVWHGAAMAAQLLGVRLNALVGCSYGDPEERGGPSEIYRLAASSRIDGYLVLSSVLANYRGAEPVRQLLEWLPRRPTVSVGIEFPGVSSVLPEGGGIGEIVEHLVQVHGLTRLAYIGGPQHNPDAIRRRADFLGTLARNGIAPHWSFLEEGDFIPESGRSCAVKILDGSATPPQAIVCANDAMAIGVRAELRNRGFRIPEDIVLTGYDNIEESRTMAPSLTTVNASIYQIGFRAVELLVEQMKGAPASTEHIPSSLVLRRSCGCRGVASSFSLPRLMVEAAGVPHPHRLRDILLDPMGAERFLAGLESSFDKAEHAELDHWEQQLMAAMVPPPPPNASRAMMEAQTLISQARHGLDLRRRQSLQHLMRDEYLAMQLLLQDLTLETLPQRLMECLRRFSDAHLRILLFHRDFSPRTTPDFGLEDFELEIDTWSEYIGPPGPDALLPHHDHGPGRWATLSIAMGSENYGIIQFREWVSNELILESFRMSLWMVLSSARKDHREKLAMAELRRLSSRDELTGLLNRRGLMEQGEVLVQAARRQRARIGVVLCDLDGLKDINDHWGHADGDLAIKCLARSLEDGFRQSDVVARLGGDEFAVLTVLGGEGSLQGAIDRVRLALVRRSTEVGKPWRARTSAGWMAWEPWDGSTLEQAMARADSLLYHDKRARKSRLTEETSEMPVFDPPPPGGG